MIGGQHTVGVCQVADIPLGRGVLLCYAADRAGVDGIIFPVLQCDRVAVFVRNRNRALRRQHGCIGLIQRPLQLITAGQVDLLLFVLCQH